ncbi:ABC transporter substrate-binding protein [Brevibacillus ginsengisoli]|uniref:ABC transporter substrate-binding protein n=1 Tax=Brevibacillus ginsengisoli TaxID=363854 RepID=UPI003CECE48A
MIRRMLSLLAICVLSLFSVLSGCASIRQQTIDAPDPLSSHPTEQVRNLTSYPSNELTIGSLDRMPTFDPFGTSKQEALLTAYESLSYRGLVTYGSKRLFDPSLASDVQINRNQGKPMITLTLRPEMRWSDGQPITTDDVLFTYQMYARPDYYGVWRNQMFLIAGVSDYRSGKAPGIAGITCDKSKRKVQISLTEERISFLDALSAPLLPQHQVADKSLEEITRLSQTGKLVGAGPYQAERLDEKKWEFEANSNYYQGKPHIDYLRVVQIDQGHLEPGNNQNPAILFSWIPPNLARSLAPFSNAAILMARGNGYHFLGFNTASAQLKDVSVRRALAQAIPVKQMAEQVFYGFAVQAKSLSPRKLSTYPTDQLPSYDPNTAKKILAQHGYTRQKRLVLTLHYPDDPVRKRMAEFVVKSWEALPVNIVTKSLPAEQFTEHVFGGNPVDLYLYAWRYPRNPSEFRALFHSGEKVGELGLNASRYVNQEADQLLEKSQAFLPDEERKRLLTKWQQRFSTDLPIFPLVEAANPYYVAKGKLKGVVEPLGAQPFDNIHQWFLE